MFANKVASFAQFSSLIKESLDRRVGSLLESEELLSSLSINEFQDAEDQLKPNMTRAEMERLLSIGREIDDASGDYKIVNIEDLHDEITDEDFHRIYMDEFGVDPSEDESLDDIAATPGEMSESANLTEGKAISQKQIEQVMGDTQSRDHAVRKVMSVFKLSRADAEKRVDAVIDAGIKEGVESLEELSKSTLGSYIKKASRDMYLKGTLARDFENRAKAKKSQEKKDYYNDTAMAFKRKAWSREDNVAKAADRLTKEDQQLDELSNSTLASYKKKAGEQSSQANAAGDFKKADKRFSGIIKATNKQFDNDAKARRSMKDEDAASFNTAAAKAHTAGKSSFEFGGKTHPVTIDPKHASVIHKKTK